MNRKDYIEAYEDGAFAMREAIKANIQNLKIRLHTAAEYNLADLDKIFESVYNMVDIRVGDEPDKDDPHADDKTGSV